VFPKESAMPEKKKPANKQEKQPTTPPKRVLPSDSEHEPAPAKPGRKGKGDGDDE
jgi:hypothetical protein